LEIHKTQELDLGGRESEHSEFVDRKGREKGVHRTPYHPGGAEKKGQSLIEIRGVEASNSTIGGREKKYI